ncbi:hypothetical protein [Plesiomonas sp.]|uniref:hypothetical protein n=1 Tax=Plesiomonas sp. TaxID=2486279 RepID=UPI003F3FA1DA
MNRLVAFFCFFVSFFALANETIQGPFNIPNSRDLVTVEKVPFEVDGESYPYLTLRVLNSKGGYVLDKYEQDGGEPNVQSIFFIKENGLQSIYSIISWFNLHREENINATFYKVYSYNIDSSGFYKKITE